MLSVFGLFLWQVELTVDQGLTTLGNVAKEDAHLTVVYLTKTATPLACNATRLGSLLGKARTIHHQGAARFAKFGVHMPTLLGQDFIVVPTSRADKLLQRAAFQALFNGDRFSS